jgi:hypothetical protein
MELTLPLNDMTTADKLSLMELLRDDLSRTPEDVPSPAWHGEILAARERAIKEGRTKFVSLEEFRRSIEKELP